MLERLYLFKEVLIQKVTVNVSECVKIYEFLYKIQFTVTAIETL
jgi:hypothetical protein